MSLQIEKDTEWNPYAEHEQTIKSLREQLAAAQAHEAELLAEIERKMSAAAFILKERDALQADNARLRSAIDAMLTHMGMDEDEWNKPTFDQAREALAATPAQSLARLRNQVREECAKVCDRFAEREMHPAECAAALRAMKELN